MVKIVLYKETVERFSSTGLINTQSDAYNIKGGYFTLY